MTPHVNISDADFDSEALNIDIRPVTRQGCGRICNNVDFNDTSRQTICNGMVPYGENGAATATCSHFPLKLLNRNGEAKKITLLVLVCEYDGNVIGCACAQGKQGHDHYGFHWDDNACNIVGCAIAKGQQGRDYHGFHWTGNECVFINISYQRPNVAKSDYDSWNGSRICTNVNFNDGSRQTICNDMVSPSENGAAAQAICSEIPINLLNGQGEPEEFILLALVCTFEDKYLGCAIAKGQQGNDYHGFYWNEGACE
ncbi:hypothetical protein U1Q18_050482 [Sarracenia purpurea var. burkii]